MRPADSSGRCPRLPRWTGTGEFQLLAAAAIWGYSFVAQSRGARLVGAFGYNAARFPLGALVLLPWVASGRAGARAAAVPGIAGGAILFFATGLQTLGMTTEDAGKSAFLTSLYLAFVPLGGLALGQPVGRSAWLGTLLALGGVHLLCSPGGFHLSAGDVQLLASALFWSVQIHWVARHAGRAGALGFSFWQFLSCGLLSAVAAAFLEHPPAHAWREAASPILYGGFLAVGLGYTLQATGQSRTPPVKAVLILSLETVFGALSAHLLLGETLSAAQTAGCALLLLGTILAQLGAPARREA